MSIYNDKETLKFAIKEFKIYIGMGDKKYSIYEMQPNTDTSKLGCMLLLTTLKKFFITDKKNEILKTSFKEVQRDIFLSYLEDFEDPNYKIYYKRENQRLVGFLLDFFIYYVEMPEKIITYTDGNNNLCKNTKDRN